MKGNLFEEAEIGIIILEVSKKGENRRKLNERKPLLITNHHRIALGCAHGDEMPADIKGQLFPIVMLSVHI